MNKSLITQIKNNILGIVQSVKKHDNKVYIKKSVQLFIIILSIFVIGVVSISLLQKSQTKEECLANFTKYLCTNENKLSKVLYVDDRSVSGEKLQPIMDYYNENEESRKQLIADLTKKNISGGFEVKLKKNILSKKYYINLKTVEVSFFSDEDKINIILGNDKNIEQNKKYTLVPGLYKVKTIINNKYGEIKKETQLEIFQDGKIKVDAGGEYITIYSNFADASVYLNDQDTGLKAEEIKDFGPVPANTMVYLSRKFPWGTIKSEKVPISNYLNLEINMANDELISNITDSLQVFYSSLFEALNNKDKTMIENCSEEGKDKIYQYINKKTLFFSNNYEISDLKLSIENSEFTYENGIYKGTIVTKINYKISKKLFSLISEQNEATFLLNMQYEDNNWIVTSGEKITVEE